MDRATIGPASIPPPTAYAVPGNLPAVGFGLAQLADALTRSLGEYDVVRPQRAPGESVAIAREALDAGRRARAAHRGAAARRAARDQRSGSQLPHRPTRRHPGLRGVL